MNNEEEAKTDLDAIRQACLDSEGYVVFVATLGEKDPQGNTVLNFRYRRYHFTLEDTKQAKDEFARQFKAELDSQFGEDDGTES